MLLAAALGFLLCLVLTPQVRALALRINLVDRADGRQAPLSLPPSWWPA
jgi:hypothetical protein